MSIAYLVFVDGEQLERFETASLKQAIRRAKELTGEHGKDVHVYEHDETTGDMWWFLTVNPKEVQP